MSGRVITWTVARTWDGRRAAAHERVTVRATPEADGLDLQVDAPYHGDPAPDGPPGPTDRLWEHEVVEWFVAGPDERYLEVELGPLGHHLVLRLVGVRRVVERGLPLEYRVDVSGARWRGRARVPRAWLPPGPHRANAYAIHGRASERRFLAAFPVPGAAPDFHRLDAFAPVDLG